MTHPNPQSPIPTYQRRELIRTRRDKALIIGKLILLLIPVVVLACMVIPTLWKAYVVLRGGTP